MDAFQTPVWHFILVNKLHIFYTHKKNIKNSFWIFLDYSLKKSFCISECLFNIGYACCVMYYTPTYLSKKFI